MIYYGVWEIIQRIVNYINRYYSSLLCFFQVRDYIHVMDLADGHIAALRKLDDLKISKDYLKTL